MAPTLLPLNVQLTAFHVILPLHGQEFSFTLHKVPGPENQGSLKNAKLECNLEMRRLLQGFERTLQERLTQSVDVSTFVIELEEILERVLCAQPKASLPSALFYTAVCSELDLIGLEHLVWLGEDLTYLRLRVFDQAGREHIIQVELPAEYPKFEPITSADLPAPIDLSWPPGSTLRDVIVQYEQAVDKYQDFWAVMEDIDKRVWVMEPEHPSRADTSRRIALGGHCSLAVTVDPLFPRSFPLCHFLGSDTSVGPLRKQLNNSAGLWKADKLLLRNLQEILQITFPTAEDKGQQDLSADCGICYAYRAIDTCSTNQGEGSIPDRACDNPKCGRLFHSSCLIEWLQSITTTRQSFDVLFGQCPYCSHPIAVKVNPS